VLTSRLSPAAEAAAGRREPPRQLVVRQVRCRLLLFEAPKGGTDKEAARRIAAAGGAVIMAVRTPSKGEAAKAEILADRSGARAFAESLLADVLVPSGSRGGPGS
jgi:hypothetical protein